MGSTSVSGDGACPLPVGWKVGDLAIGVLYRNGTGLRPTPVAGWTTIGYTTSGTRAPLWTACYRVLQAGDVSLQRGGGNGSSASAVSVYHGVRYSKSAQYDSGATAGTTLTIPAVTLLRPGSWVASVACAAVTIATGDGMYLSSRSDGGYGYIWAGDSFGPEASFDAGDSFAMGSSRWRSVAVEMFDEAEPSVIWTVPG